MTGLDTNGLVRFLAQDDPQQSPEATEIMRSLTSDSPGWVGLTVLVELVWVLGSNDRYDRATIIRTIDQLLLLEELAIEHADSVRAALRLFRNGKADFADCLIAVSAEAAGCSRTVTFYRKAARDAGMELIG